MKGLTLSLSHDEILALYRIIIDSDHSDPLSGVFVLLQKYLFANLTIDEMQRLSRNE